MAKQRRKRRLQPFLPTLNKRVAGKALDINNRYRQLKELAAFDNAHADILARRGAVIMTRLEAMEVEIAEGNPKVKDTVYIQYTNLLRRLLLDLGIDPAELESAGADGYIAEVRTGVGS